MTDRGTLVADLVPAGAGMSIIDRLAAAGEYEPPVGSILDVPPPPPTLEGGECILIHPICPCAVTLRMTTALALQRGARSEVSVGPV